MNSLSFLIYLSGVTGSMSGFLTFVMVAFGVLALISLVVWIIMHDETDGRQAQLVGEALQSCREMRQKSWGWFWRFTYLFVIVGMLASLTPSRQTVLLIAASEMGEKVLNHPRVQTVMDPGIELLTTWMAKETQDLKKQMTAHTKP